MEGKQQQPRTVPMIRLKLRVREEKNVSEEVKESKIEISKDNKAEERVPETMVCVTTTLPPVTLPECKYHGTFLYRPFKLFPLLPVSSRFRVFVPRRHIAASNPAVKLNYFWKSGGGVYTDDSDLVCILMREGHIRGVETRGDLLVEVEVVQETEECEDESSVINALEPRIYPAPHDGNHIKIRSCTVISALEDHRNVHLKSWRKHAKEQKAATFLTPKFKTKHGI